MYEVCTREVRRKYGGRCLLVRERYVSDTWLIRRRYVSDLEEMGLIFAVYQLVIGDINEVGMSCGNHVCKVGDGLRYYVLFVGKNLQFFC